MSSAPRLRLFKCPACGVEEYRWRTYAPLPEGVKPSYVGEDVPVPVIWCTQIGVALDGRELNCPVEMEQVLAGIRHDLLPDSFVVDDIDGKGSRRISSLTELREIERQSEQKHRNGEGQIVNFREFSQDRPNRLVNSLAGSSYEKGKSRRPDSRKTVAGLPIDIRATSHDVH